MNKKSISILIILVIHAGCREPHSAPDRITATVVEEYPLVYPEWEYNSPKEGCPYRYKGIKVQANSENPVYIVSDNSDLPHRGSAIVIKQSSLSEAKLGTLNDMPVYDVSKLKYHVVVNHKDKE
jgi:hypothetical protein